ncbi:MAG: hypothetical protein MRK02_02985 [Candidatus Scalindua sp.]|nr:hypothetical protein [Candidatus Scalindua sp.]
MSIEKTWNNCVFYDTDLPCPHSKDEYMKQFRRDVPFDQTYKAYDDSKSAEINKRFCNNCDSFRPIN